MATPHEIDVTTCCVIGLARFASSQSYDGQTKIKTKTYLDRGLVGDRPAERLLAVLLACCRNCVHPPKFKKNLPTPAAVTVASAGVVAWPAPPTPPPSSSRTCQRQRQQQKRISVQVFFSLHFRDDFKFRTAMNVTSAFLLFLFFFYKKRYREGY